MLRTFISGLVLAGASLHAAAADDSFTIDFDDLAGGPIFAGEQVSNQYSGLGVTFSNSFHGGGGLEANNTLGSLIAGASAPNVLWVDHDGGYSKSQYLQIDFANAVKQVDMVFGISRYTNFTIEAYGASGWLDWVTVGPTQQQDFMFSGTASIAVEGITSLRIYSNYGEASYNFSIDNLVVTHAPEPSSLAMALAGMALLGVYGHARRRQA